MLVHKGIMVELAGCKVGEDFGENYTVVVNEFAGRNRWTLRYKLVFTYGGKFYQSHYEVGATENQDQTPYGYYADMVNCLEVVPKEKLVTVYEHAS